MHKGFRLSRGMRAAGFALGLVATLCLVSVARAQEVKITEETPYVQSPKIVVDTMLRMAGVNANDFLIDLGSGDGRIIINAAKERKARGFGVDYDSRLVKLANENARKAGVSDRASFFEQNIFQTDLGAATVVTMYLLPEYNLALQQRLLALRPGTRIVSHDYGIGDWKADASEKIAVPEKKVGVEKASTILFWIVPAKIGGHWRSSIITASGATEIEFDLRQSFQNFEGTAKVHGREMPIERPFLRAGYLSFRVTDGDETLVFQGNVSNSRIAGKLIRGGETLRWRALRTEEQKG